MTLDKNILLLLPTEYNEYLNYHKESLCLYAKKVVIVCVGLDFLLLGSRRLEQKILAIIKDEGIDWIISMPFGNSFEIAPNFYALLADKTKLIFWMFDDEMHFLNHSRYLAQAAHTVVTTDVFSVSGYNALGIESLFYASSHPKEIYHKTEDVLQIDVSFIGDLTKSDRMEMIDYLRQNGVIVDVFGKGSENGFIDKKKLQQIFSRSKINLNFSKTDAIVWTNHNEPLLALSRQNKGRPIEIALCGGFCLSEYAIQLSAIFNPSEEVAIFDSKETLLEQVKYYLTHDDERQKIANKAHAKAMLYERSGYFPKILEQLLVMTDRSKPYYDGHIRVGREFKINHSIYMLGRFFRQIERRAWGMLFEILCKSFSYGVANFLIASFRFVMLKIKRLI